MVLVTSGSLQRLQLEVSCSALSLDKAKWVQDSDLKAKDGEKSLFVFAQRTLESVRQWHRIKKN